MRKDFESRKKLRYFRYGAQSTGWSFHCQNRSSTFHTIDPLQTGKLPDSSTITQEVSMYSKD